MFLIWPNYFQNILLLLTLFAGVSYSLRVEKDVVSDSEVSGLTYHSKRDALKTNKSIRKSELKQKKKLYKLTENLGELEIGMLRTPIIHKDIFCCLIII